MVISFNKIDKTMKKQRYMKPDMYAVSMDTLPLMLGGSNGDDIGGSVTPPGMGGGGSRSFEEFEDSEEYY